MFILLMVGTRVGANSGELTCTKLSVVDAEGNLQVVLGATPNGDGMVGTYSPEGKLQVALGGTTAGAGGGAGRAGGVCIYLCDTMKHNMTSFCDIA